MGPRGRQEVVPVEQLETVSVVHKTSRAGDPPRHIHFQIGTRTWAAGAWRGWTRRRCSSSKVRSGRSVRRSSPRTRSSPRSWSGTTRR
ncbi:MAG: relaxase domain-containing protein [Actinomycetota bacterium]